MTKDNITFEQQNYDIFLQTLIGLYATHDFVLLEECK